MREQLNGTGYRPPQPNAPKHFYEQLVSGKNNIYHMTKTQNYVEKVAKRLVIGDKVLSASGKILTVSLVVFLHLHPPLECFCLWRYFFLF